MVRRKSKKRGPVASKKISYDGINFASGLERYTYMALKKAKLYEGYENEVLKGMDKLIKKNKPVIALDQLAKNFKNSSTESINFLKK